MNQEDKGNNPSNPICMCNNPPRIGVTVGFWEPVRIAEVVRRPYCFVSLGGVKLDPGIDAPNHAQTARKEGRTRHGFYHVHWYTNPLMFWLELLLDSNCLEQGVFDLFYFTEIDPLWADSTTGFIINPDVALFSTPIAQAACAADCVAATTGFPRNDLFWCAGCQGTVYPLTGWVGNYSGGVRAAELLMQRFTNKAHRQGMIWAASGNEGMCSLYPQVLMDKTNYKAQMLYPVPNTQKVDGKCCHPFGRTTTIWGSGKEYPYKGEDFTFQIFRKRNCCGGNFLSPTP
jgi:conjugal transfer pilus assembly protein TraU